ncbi:MAG: sodium/proton-translocating pyrophosphatase, partial [Thermodesulfovibrionales bacterium]|nr:sodium/proton-translocating pyrophosphatase [Thermodesulfovibrionales bacterium]
MNYSILSFAPLTGVFSLLFAGYLAFKVSRSDPGNEKMREIASYIHEGAMAFLTREYKALSVFIAAVSVIVSLLINIQTAFAFLVGALFSIGAGYFGMQVATKA